MRCAAKSRASRCAGGTRWAAALRSASATRRPAASVSRRSNLRVYSTRAASPRARTSATISATTRPTFSSLSRLRPRKAENSVSKPGAEASSRLGGTGDLAEAVDPVADALGLRLERGAVDDEARGDVGDVLELDQAVVLERATRIDQVDDAVAEPERGCELHRARQLHAFGLHAAGGEVPARHLGILGGNAHMAPTARIVAARHLDGLGHSQPALADAEIDRGIDLRVVELHQHVGAGDAEVSGAEGDEGCDIEGAHADDVEIGVIGGEAKLARLGIGEGRLGLDAGAREQGQRLGEDASLGQRQDQRLVGLARHPLAPVTNARPLAKKAED